MIRMVLYDSAHLGSGSGLLPEGAKPSLGTIWIFSSTIPMVLTCWYYIALAIENEIGFENDIFQIVANAGARTSLSTARQ